MLAGDQAHLFWIALGAASAAALVILALSYIRAAEKLHEFVRTQYPEQWGISDRDIMPRWFTAARLENIVDGFSRLDIADTQFKTLLWTARLRALCCGAAFVVLLAATVMLPRT
jgi:hypothetical protein